jgi:hypothetical protein
MTRMGFVLLTGLLIWTSCTKATLHYYGRDRGLVQIYPDRSVHALPALEYYFYSADVPETIRENSDGEGNFEGELPCTTYRTIATNTAAAVDGSVAFTTDSYESATVTALPTGQSYNQLSIVNSPLSIYSVVVEELIVTPDVRTYRPVPVLLTKQLEFVFVLSGGLETEVKTIAGVLPGVYASVYLSTGLPTPESTAQSPATAVRFDIAGQGDERKAEVSLFGLRHPEYGAVYTNSLELTLTMNDDSEETVSVDLTKELSDILSQNQGVLPQKTSVVIRLDRVSVDEAGDGITGSLLGWKVEEIGIITVY